jgi:cation:H+ antiporter
MNDTLLMVAQILGGLALLVGGGEVLVRGASGLAAAARITPLVIGLTVVAFGTSAPELAVAVQSAMVDKTDLAVGNAVGSNIVNILLIVGISAVISPLVISSQVIRWDVPIMILACFSLLIVGWDGKINWLEGLVLFGSLLVYIAWSVRQSRHETVEVQQEFAAESPREQRTLNALVWFFALVVVGLTMLTAGSHWLVQGSIAVAQKMGVSELIIGLTIVAIGTSLPEAVTSIVAALRGERDIAVGNIVGSNTFNILCVLGLASLVAPQGIDVSSEALRFDIPIMIAVAIACLPVFFTGHRIARWEGAVFLFYYAAYTFYLFLDVTQNEYQRTVAGIMGFFVIPLTTITIIISLLRYTRRLKEAA